MKILVTNDDGINAEGIRVLAKTLSAEHEVTVIAPDAERSGASHSLSYHSPIIYEKADFEGGIHAYRVFGTPADCVKFGILYVLKDKPDVVVSGINRGANLGTDVMYSGTVAAAMEAVYLGVRGIAISASPFIGITAGHYETAAKYLLNNLKRLLELSPPDGTLFNINVPPRTSDEINGVKFTPTGVQEYDDVYIPHDEKAGSYMLRGKPVAHGKNPDDCDIEWIKKGYITVTPIRYDMTDYGFLSRVRDKNTDNVQCTSALDLSPNSRDG